MLYTELEIATPIIIFKCRTNYDRFYCRQGIRKDSDASQFVGDCNQVNLQLYLEPFPCVATMEVSYRLLASPSLPSPFSGATFSRKFSILTQTLKLQKSTGEGQSVHKKPDKTWHDPESVIIARRTTWKYSIYCIKKSLKSIKIKTKDNTSLLIFYRVAFIQKKKVKHKSLTQNQILSQWSSVFEYQL